MERLLKNSLRNPALASGILQRAGARMRPVGTRQGGFTLIELMVVIVVMAILLALLLPNLVRSKYQGQLASCEHNERAIASAMENYATQYRRYPSALSLIFTNNFVQAVYCPSNRSSYGYDVDGEGKAFTVYCQGIHSLVLPQAVNPGYPQYNPGAGLSRRP